MREKLSDLLGEKVRQIIDIMDKPDYTPKLQNQSQLDTIYESDFKDIQPYLFRVSFIDPICLFFAFDFSQTYSILIRFTIRWMAPSIKCPWAVRSSACLRTLSRSTRAAAKTNSLSVKFSIRFFKSKLYIR